jgi:hypothetical protein
VLRVRKQPTVEGKPQAAMILDIGYWILDVSRLTFDV